MKRIIRTEESYTIESGETFTFQLGMRFKILGEDRQYKVFGITKEGQMMLGTYKDENVKRPKSYQYNVKTFKRAISAKELIIL